MMIQIEHTEVFGWEASIRGCRNPFNSWNKSDTVYGLGEDLYADMRIGENDLALMKKLSKAGSDHSKFLRMINVTADITAPRYWWTEYDTYKVGTVANSTSTMHKIHEKEFTLEDFSFDQLLNTDCDLFGVASMDGVTITVVQPIHFLHNYIIPSLNVCREKYLETKSKDCWYAMIQLLPQSYNQKRTVQLNYQVLKSMYQARKNHKLDEWREFCKWCETLPYFKKICVEVEK